MPSSARDRFEPTERRHGVGPGTWDALNLAAALLFMLGSFYYYVAGVHYEDRTLSRVAALAFLVFGVVAVVMFVRVLS